VGETEDAGDDLDVVAGTDVVDDPVLGEAVGEDDEAVMRRRRGGGRGSWSVRCSVSGVRGHGD
jgi:hypothetical protein